MDASWVMNKESDKKERFKLSAFSEAIFLSSPLKLGVIVFFIAIVGRLFLSLLFFKKWGEYATFNTEVWYYFGVAKGIFKLSIFDPTVWILRAEGLLLPEKFLFHSIALTASVMSSLTAVLIFLLVYKLHGKKAGFVAGIMYAAAPQPLALSTVGFTHDLVQLPIIVLSLIAAVYFTELKGSRRIISLAVIILLLFLGVNAGLMILVAAVVLPAYFIGWIIRSGRYGLPSERAYLGLLIGLTVVLLVIRIAASSNFLQNVYSLAEQYRGIDVLAQQRGGSMDTLPVSINNFWHKYNFLLFFIPFGLARCFKKKDTIAFSLLLVGVISSTLFERGTRIVDLGIPMVASLALINWKREWSKYMVFLLAVAFLIIIPLAGTTRNYSVAFILLGGLIFLILHLSSDLPSNKKSISANRAITLALVIIIVFGVIKVDLKPYTLQAEYLSFKWLDAHSGANETIYVRWDHGYFAEAVAGLKSVSSPEHIDFEVPKFFWYSEKDAYQSFKERNISYIQISKMDFMIPSADLSADSYSYKYNRGIIYPPPYARFSQLRETLMFKLLYDEKSLKYFQKIHSEVDRKTGFEIRLFKIV
jgi:hypothetical protein